MSPVPPIVTLIARSKGKGVKNLDVNLLFEGANNFLGELLGEIN